MLNEDFNPGRRCSELEHGFKIIEGMLRDQKLGVKLVGNNLQKLIKTLRNLLTKFAYDLKQENTYITESVIDCENSIKLLLSLKSSFQQEFHSALQEMSCETNDPSVMCAELRECLLQVVDMLQNVSRTFLSSLSAALFLVTLFKEVCPEKEESKQIVQAFFSSSPNESILNKILQQKESFSVYFSKFGELAKLCVNRAIMICFEPKLLTSSVNQFIDNKLERKQTILIDLIFDSIVRSCTPNSSSLLKIVGFQTLSAWSSSIQEAIAMASGEGRGVEDLFGMPTKQFFSEIASKLVSFSLGEWGDSEQVASMVQNRFASVLELLDSLVEKLAKTEEEKKLILQIYDDLVEILTENQQNKALHRPLAMMVRRYGSKVVKDKKQLLERILNDLNSHTATSMQGSMTLLQTIFVSLREENEQIPKEKLVEESSSSFWAKPVVSSLCGENESASSSCTTHIVPMLFESFQTSFCARKLLQLISEDCKESKKDIISSFPHLKAVLTVAKHARKVFSLSLSSAQKLCEEIEGLPSLEDLILQCIEHQELDIRIFALEIACSSIKSSEVVSEFEFSAFKKFLRINLKVNEQGFRNKSLSICTNFLNRHKDSSIKLIKEKSRRREESLESLFLCVRHVYDQVEWIVQLLTASLYPDSPYPRECFALLLLKELEQCSWDKENAVEQVYKQTCNKQKVTPKELKLELENEVTCAMIFHTGNSRFEYVRQRVLEVLFGFQTLKGFESTENVRFIFERSLRMLNSSRLKETDCGATQLFLLYNKLLLDGSFSVQIKEGEKVQVIASLKREKKKGKKGKEESFECDPHKNSLSFLYELLKELKRQTRLPLREASVKGPMHGVLLLMKHVISKTNLKDSSNKKQWALFFEELLQLIGENSERCLEIVGDLLIEGYSENSSDPLGKLRKEFENENSSHIKVCAWHTIKESCLLMAEMVECVGHPEEEEVMSLERVKWVGDLMIKVVLSTKHRGTLEIACEAFTQLCSYLLKCSNSNYYGLPKHWLEEFLENLVNCYTRKSNLVITRRSAGLPFSFCAVLRAECNVKLTRDTKTLISFSIESLLKIANSEQEGEGGEDLVKKGFNQKVHALNVIRHLLRDKYISDHLKPFLEEITLLTLQNYASDSFVIRNSATLIFTPLVQRLLKLRQLRSLQESRVKDKTFASFFAKFPRVLHFIRQTLQTASKVLEESGKTPHYVYPLLLVLSQLCPSHHTNSTKLKSEQLVPLVSCFLESNERRIREMSSKAIIALTYTENCVSLFHRVLSSLASHKTWNQTEGNLFILFHSSFKSSTSNLPEEQISSILNKLEGKLGFFEKNRCPPTTLLFFRVCLNFSQSNLFKRKLANFSSSILFSERKSLDIMESSLELELSEFLSSFVLELSQKKEDSSCEEFKWKEILERLLNHPKYEVRSSALKKVKEILKKKSQNFGFDEKTKMEMEPILFGMLDKEKHWECISLLISVLRRIRLQFPNENKLETILELWEKVEGIKKSYKQTESWSSCLGLEGHFIHTILSSQNENKFAENPKFLGKLTSWVEEVEKLSMSKEPVESRLASLKAVSYFGEEILSHVSSESFSQDVVSLFVRVWNVLLRILQDDDQENRQRASFFLTSKVLKTNSVDESKALELAYHFFSQKFRNCFSLFQLFSNKISKQFDFDVNFNVKEFTKEPERIIFDIEPHNYFVEIPLKVQFLSFQLINNVIPSLLNGNKVERENLVEDPLSKVCISLSKFSHSLQSQREKLSEAWTQVICENSFVFTSLYTLLMALCVYFHFQPSDTQSKQQKEEEIDLSLSLSLESLFKFNLNPLHLKVLFTVQDLLEKNGWNLPKTKQILSTNKPSSIPFHHLPLFFLTNFD